MKKKRKRLKLKLKLRRLEFRIKTLEMASELLWHDVYSLREIANVNIIKGEKK